jgi:hypothetical protein
MRLVAHLYGVVAHCLVPQALDGGDRPAIAGEDWHQALAKERNLTLMAFVIYINNYK